MIFDKYKKKIRDVLSNSLELAQIRLNVAGIELNDFFRKVIVIFIYVLISFFLLATSVLSLFFALNIYLPEELKLQTFFSISIVTFIICLCLFLVVYFKIKSQKHMLYDTLKGIKEDISSLKEQDQKLTINNEDRV